MERLKKHWGDLTIVGLTIVLLLYTVQQSALLSKIDESEAHVVTIENEVTAILKIINSDDAARNQILQEMQNDNAMRNKILDDMKNDSEARNKILQDMQKDNEMRNKMLQDIEHTLEEISKLLKTPG